MIYINEISITNFLVYAINNMLSNLLSSINTNIDNLLDKIVFVNSDILINISSVIGISFNSGIKLICNSLIYGFLLYYAISYLLSHFTFSQTERPSQFIFKLLLCALALNGSQFLCSSLVYTCSYISDMILALGKYLFDFDISFSTLITQVFPNDYFISNSFSLFSFDGILKASVTFGFFSLAISYSIRFILLKVLMILSPLAILSLANSKTSWFFKSWFKNLFAMMFLQIFIAIILLVCFIIDNKDTFLPAQIMHIGMIYTLFKANSFVKEFVGGFSTDANLTIPNISSILKGGN